MSVDPCIEDRSPALTGGHWEIDRRRRIQVWVPDPVVMHPSEWRQIQDGAA